MARKMKGTHRKTYLAKSSALEQATQMQFRLVDIMSKHLNGYEMLQAGDYGVAEPLHKPTFTVKVEKVLAEYFGAKEAILVRGAGTGAIRSALGAALNPGDRIIAHKAQLYPTTAVTIRMMGLEVVYADMNNLEELKEAINDTIKLVYIQSLPHKHTDKYTVKDVIGVVKSTKYDPLIMTDDCYVIFRGEKTGSGCELGADISAFSLFKLLGPEGIGLILGCTERSVRIVEQVRKDNYSGGCQVQGPEAMEALRSLVYTPVALAITTLVRDEVVRRLNKGEVEGIKRAYKKAPGGGGFLVEFKEPIADKFNEACWKHGALPHPVGAESRYEVSVLISRAPERFMMEFPKLAGRVTRVLDIERYYQRSKTIKENHKSKVILH